MIDLEFFEPKTSPIKVTIHKTGKIGLSKGFTDEYGITSRYGVRIAKQKGDQSNSLYFVFAERTEKGVFNFRKQGDYYYLATTGLLDSIGFDFRKKPTICRVHKIDENTVKIIIN